MAGALRLAGTGEGERPCEALTTRAAAATGQAATTGGATTGRAGSPRVRGDRPGGQDRPRPAVLPAAPAHGHAVIARRTLLTGAVLAAAGAIAARPGPPAPPPPAPPAPTLPPPARGRRLRGRQRRTQITFDPYSLLIDGDRTFIWSGEFHPFRLPSPSLWLDVLQKMKASGYNAVSMYFNWSYHSPAPGQYDFTGVRDMARPWRWRRTPGCYVIARPGPYINAEVNAGGYPGGSPRPRDVRAPTTRPTGLRGRMADRDQRHPGPYQLTDGGGTLILYQIENEYASFVGAPTGVNYIAHLYAKVRADGIAVPIFHNDKGRNGYWTPGSFPAPDRQLPVRLRRVSLGQRRAA